MFVVVHLLLKMMEEADLFLFPLSVATCLFLIATGRCFIAARLFLIAAISRCSASRRARTGRLGFHPERPSNTVHHCLYFSHPPYTSSGNCNGYRAKEHAATLRIHTTSLQLPRQHTGTFPHARIPPCTSCHRADRPLITDD